MKKIQIQNSIVCLKALVLLNCFNTFVNDCTYGGSVAL